VFFSALGASIHHRARFSAAKALAEQPSRRRAWSRSCSRRRSSYAPGDPWLTLLERLALLPVMPVVGTRGARCISRSGRRTRRTAWWAALRKPGGEHRGEPRREARSASGGPWHARAARGRYELAGPGDAPAHNDLVRVVLGSLNRKRLLVHVPTPVVSRSLRLLERVAGANAFCDWDEAELMEVPMGVGARGADVKGLGLGRRGWRGCWGGVEEDDSEIPDQHALQGRRYARSWKMLRASVGAPVRSPWVPGAVSGVRGAPDGPA